MSTDSEPTFKDRKGLLIFTGIIEFLIGLLCVGLTGLTLLGTILGSQSGEYNSMSLGAMISGSIFYVLLAIGFIWLGIGTIRTKRWSRDIGLVASALWFIGGLVSMGFMLYMMPRMADAMAVTDESMSPQVVRVFQVVMLSFSAVFYVLLPLLFLLVYRSPHVKATCETNDPQPGWTSRCPLPVLVVVFCLAWGVPGALLMLGYNVLPVFGSLVTGPVAVIGLLILAATLAVLTVWTYRLEPQGWWGTLGLVILMGASGIYTFLTVPTQEYYRLIGTGEDAAEMAQIYNWQDPVMISWMAAWVLVALGYLVYVKKFFKPAVPEFPTQG